MSVQILVHGKLEGIEPFLVSAGAAGGPPDDAALLGRSHWVTLLSEVVPRALLAEFGLARVLLGSGGGGQFLLVLPEESRQAAREFLDQESRHARELSGGQLRMICAITENLGDWSVVRKRLADDFDRQSGAAAAVSGETFAPFLEDARPADDYFVGEISGRLWQAESVGWSPEAPARLAFGPAKHSWSLVSGRGDDDIVLARHAAPSEDGAQPAEAAALARRAQGRRAWGVLRGDVDNLRVRLRRLQTVEEHVRLSVLYKQFFAGELEVLCSQPEFWRKVSVLYSGGDDFAVYGSWDALIPLAREIERLFHRFTEENLKDFPGPEGKTISMAVALAPEADTPLAAVYAVAGQRLEEAKTADKDCIHVLGRTLEWKHLAGAAELKDTLSWMVSEMGSSRQFLHELAAFYRKGGRQWGSGEERFEKPWQFQRRLNRLLAGARDRESQKLRAHLSNEMMGKSAAQVKLRPAGLVALEWARLFTEE
jgi:CRISPR-associated protein Csm1